MKFSRSCGCCCQDQIRPMDGGVVKMSSAQCSVLMHFSPLYHSQSLSVCETHLSCKNTVSNSEGNSVLTLDSTNIQCEIYIWHLAIQKNYIPADVITFFFSFKNLHFIQQSLLWSPELFMPWSAYSHLGTVHSTAAFMNLSVSIGWLNLLLQSQ